MTSGPVTNAAQDRVLGYLNFSSGARDPRFYSDLNLVATHLEEYSLDAIHQLLLSSLDRLRSENSAFKDTRQAEIVIDLAFEQVPKAYLEYHKDLLFHLSADQVFNPFFLAEVIEYGLQQSDLWENTPRLVKKVIRSIDDFIGYRPIPTLHSRAVEPYRHEFVKPTPLYVREAGVVCGRFQDIVDKAIEILRETDPEILSAAHFSLELLDELAVDPRAFDFEHPVNKRPNYHFGQWDPHRLDNQSRFRRYVIQNVTLHALTSRYEEPGDLSSEELLFEAGAVLAGTILMGSGICGSEVNAFGSNETIATILPNIARYRDVFYESLLMKMTGAHAARLQQEAINRHQPFGAARQDLNARIATLRASQTEHVELASTFAKMGYPEAASRQANVIPVASARMLCRINCCLTEGRQSIRKGNLETAIKAIQEIMELIHRGIECGAIIDPWNIIGFGANFALFPAVENTIHDHRADELANLMEQLFSLSSLLWCQCAAVNNPEWSETTKRELVNSVQWWNQFAAHEVSSINACHGIEFQKAAERVVGAMSEWNQSGAQVGDIKFWKSHAQIFESPRAFALVIDALLNKRDHTASMALLIHWLSHSDEVSIQEGSSSFSQLARRWMRDQLDETIGSNGENDICQKSIACFDRLNRFFDFVEANAADLWEVPEFRLGTSKGTTQKDPAYEDFSEPVELEENEIFGAAYEDVVYKDSTDDGIDGEIFEPQTTSEAQLNDERRRLEQRLAFLNCVTKLWQTAAAISVRTGFDSSPELSKRLIETISSWKKIASQRREDLQQLLTAVQNHKLPKTTNDLESVVDYDRHRMFKEYLLDIIIQCYVETEQAIRSLSIAETVMVGETSSSTLIGEDDQNDEPVFIKLMAATIAGNRTNTREVLKEYLEALKDKPIVYIPLMRRGDPQKIVRARLRQQAITQLLEVLPRIGLLVENCELIDAVRDLERRNPVGPRAITEFDEIFRIGFRTVVRSLSKFGSTDDMPKSQQRERLFQWFESFTEPMLVVWVQHSKTLRLSVLEKVTDEAPWKALVEFIQTYGADLFSQKFLTYPNIRAILHQGVENWIEQVREQDDIDFRLLDEIGEAIPYDDAVLKLTLILESIAENYGEYSDYNSTTTQSDRGDLLYTLLDFLRVRMRYDRIAWHLNPVVWEHETLVEENLTQVAKQWRSSLRERVKVEANRYSAQLKKLQSKYSMRMPTIVDRISERFVKPMQIDRMRALIPLAMNDPGSESAFTAFRLLEKEVDQLTKTPSGVGLEIPHWIECLQDEVDRENQKEYREIDDVDLWILNWKSMSADDIESQIDSIKQRFLPNSKKSRLRPDDNENKES